MQRIILALHALVLLFAFVAFSPASAQTPAIARVVPSCGSATYSLGGNNPITVDTTGALCGSVGSGSSVTAKSGTYVSSGTDQFALAVSTNTQLTVPATTTCAQITVEVANIRRTSDGTSATTTNGTLIPAGSAWQDCGPLAAYKFTAVSGSPTLDVEYFK